MVQELEKQPNAQCLLLTTEATREQSINYGCVVVNDENEVVHYVDKPTTFLSTHISCGLYLLRPSIWEHLEEAASAKLNGSQSLWFETDVFPQMASASKLHALHTTRWWSQTKTPGAALYANRHYLRLFRERCPERLAVGTEAEIVGDVFIDPTATVHKSAKIGPNVSICANAVIGAGVRIRESIILPECVIEDHSCVLHSVIGWRCVLGAWSRVEGTPVTPNPNVAFAKIDNKPLFNTDGRLNPSLTILGSDVHVLREIVILNTVVLPYKELTTSKMNQIIL